MFKRIYAIFRARNLEFMRDRSSLSWNIIFPVMLMFGLSFIFSSGDRALYTVGVLQSATEIDVEREAHRDVEGKEKVVVVMGNDRRWLGRLEDARDKGRRETPPGDPAQ